MIRKATMQDLPAIVDIYAYARNFMVKTGNANQWGDGYPQEKLLRDDIAQKQLYMIGTRRRDLRRFCLHHWRGSDLRRD